jgi:hypothetical protein
MLALISKFGTYVFLYSTDFVINLANLTGLSYYEINTFIFIVMWPLLTVFLLFICILQKFRLAKAKYRCRFS